ncbi:unnamed protein product [Orchesella dallaii]|uniref:Uncharacterized protein n=1 Tax=Orchesella dallaii TaxID=48710 RepID=A0ABP1RK82_9HEXA
MGLFFNLIVLLSAVTLISAVPLQFRVPITVVQSPYPGAGSNTHFGVTGQCIYIQYNNIATEIRLTRPSNNQETFKIYYFSTSCFEYPSNPIRNETLLPSSVLIVNRRKPVCHFQLETSDAGPVDVTFYYGTNSRQTKRVSDGRHCMNRCSSQQTSLNFPHSVYFTRNGNPIEINNDIHLFTQGGCVPDKYLGIANTQKPYNLVENTQESGAQVKSFVIWEDV